MENIHNWYRIIGLYIALHIILFIVEWYKYKHSTLSWYGFKEDVDKYFQNVFAKYIDPERPYKAFEHNTPLYQEHATCTFDFKVFSFGGIILWPKELEGTLLNREQGK